MIHSAACYFVYVIFTQNLSKCALSMYYKSLFTLSTEHWVLCMIKTCGYTDIYLFYLRLLILWSVTLARWRGCPGHDTRPRLRGSRAQSINQRQELDHVTSLYQSQPSLLTDGDGELWLTLPPPTTGERKTRGENQYLIFQNSSNINTSQYLFHNGKQDTPAQLPPWLGCKILSLPRQYTKTISSRCWWWGEAGPGSSVS